MPEITPESLWAVIEKLRKGGTSAAGNTLIHCITNYVTAADCANAVLAAGARPVMADSPAECAEITAKAGALVLNMGTFSEEHGQAMLISGRAANRAGIPVILDPVGVQASSLRREWFRRLTKEVCISVIRGNLAEMTEVAGGSLAEAETSCAAGVPVQLRAVKKAAELFGCTALLTGGEDWLSDGSSAVRFDNGTPLLVLVTGTGCMTGALIGAYASAAGGNMLSCGAAVSLMNICGELAAEDFRGTGTFRAELIDGFSQITREQFISRCRITNY